MRMVIHTGCTLNTTNYVIWPHHLLHTGWSSHWALKIAGKWEKMKISSAILNTQKKQKLELSQFQSLQKKWCGWFRKYNSRGSSFCKATLHSWCSFWQCYTNFKINLNFGNTIIDKLALRYCSNHANWMIFPEWVHAAYLTCWATCPLKATCP